MACLFFYFGPRLPLPTLTINCLLGILFLYPSFSLTLSKVALPRHLDRKYRVVEFSTHEPSGLKIHGTDEGNHYFLLEHNCIKLPKHYKEVHVMENALSTEVCKEIIDKAEAYEWTEKRHKAFATTDIPLEALYGTFSNIQAHIDCRVLPRIATTFGLHEDFLQIGEIFIVKYAFNRVIGNSSNADLDTVKFGSEKARSETQVGLAPHKDGTPWSFVLPLNDDTEFEGGGTYFVDSDKIFRPPKGSAVLFNGKNEHMGVPITSGKRFLMVGFINYVNRKDTSHEEFLRGYDRDRDGSAACCASSAPLNAFDLDRRGGTKGILVDETGGIHTGDKLCGIVDNDIVTMLNTSEFNGKLDLQERLLASTRLGRKGMLKLIVERDEECETSHRIRKTCFRLLASQNYWDLDTFLKFKEVPRESSILKEDIECTK